MLCLPVLQKKSLMGTEVYGGWWMIFLDIEARVDN